MKKLFTLVLATAAVFSASAANTVIYNNGAITPGLNVYGWYNASMNFAADNPTGGTTKVYNFKSENGDPAASMGIYADGTTFVTGPLHSANLNFSWYATTAGTTYTVRVTASNGAEQNFTWTTEASNINQWNTVSINVAEAYPTVSAQWNEYKGKGAGYVFSIVMEGGTADSNIYFDNIYYSNIDEAWTAPATPEIIPPTTVPAIAQPQEDVLSIFSEYGIVSYGVGSWGQSTQCENVTIDGKPAVKLTNFNYLGWEFANHFSIANYDYMHVDFYPCEPTNFGFTPISPGAERGWIAPTVTLNEWNSYDAPISYFNNVVLNDIFQIKFDQGQGVEAYLANVYFYTSGNETPDEPATGTIYENSVEGVDRYQADGEMKEFPYTCNYSVIYNENQTLTVKVNFVWHNGEPVGIVPGSVFINNVLNDFTMVDGTRIATTTATYAAGDVLSMNIYIPRYAGVLEVPFTYTVGSGELQNGIADVEVANGPVEYYNLQGVRVANPERGLFIRVQNGKATKVLVK